jgi:predicted alpha/beta-hydrolase family hydrolase
MYEITTASIPVSDSIGSVSVIIAEPSELLAILVLAHGAGAGMTHPFMESMALSLAEVGIGTVRYNFPYMENRKRRPDPPAIAHRTILEVVNRAHALYPDAPIFAGGKSFGGRMTSQLMATSPLHFVNGIVLLGFPLHPAGKPSTDRAVHLGKVEVPMLFLQGTRDTLAEMALMNEVCASLPGATLMAYDGADHSFKAGKKNLIPELASDIYRWVSDRLE